MTLGRRFPLIIKQMRKDALGTVPSAPDVKLEWEVTE